MLNLTLNFFLYIICNAIPYWTAATLLPIIRGKIRPWSAVMSDQWRAYTNVGQISGLRHLTVNHSLNFVELASGAHNQRIQRSWKSAKERNKRQNGTHRSMFGLVYMCEFMWRNCIKVRVLNAFETIFNDYRGILVTSLGRYFVTFLFVCYPLFTTLLFLYYSHFSFCLMYNFFPELCHFVLFLN